jgi:hypothetical protein
MSNMLKFVKYSKSYNSSSEKINKILTEIKREDEERNKGKNQKNNSDFQKLFEKIKKRTRRSIHFLPVSKCYKILKSLVDLIKTYLQDTQRKDRE